jgi:hypothetical protein
MSQITNWLCTGHAVCLPQISDQSMQRAPLREHRIEDGAMRFAVAA